MARRIKKPDSPLSKNRPNGNLQVDRAKQGSGLSQSQKESCKLTESAIFSKNSISAPHKKGNLAWPSPKPQHLIANEVDISHKNGSLTHISNCHKCAGNLVTRPDGLLICQSCDNLYKNSAYDESQWDKKEDEQGFDWSERPLPNGICPKCGEPAYSWADDTIYLCGECAHFSIKHDGEEWSHSRNFGEFDSMMDRTLNNKVSVYNPDKWKIEKEKEKETSLPLPGMAICPECKSSELTLTDGYDEYGKLEAHCEECNNVIYSETWTSWNDKEILGDPETIDYLGESQGWPEPDYETWIREKVYRDRDVQYPDWNEVERLWEYAKKTGQIEDLRLVVESLRQEAYANVVEWVYEYGELPFNPEQFSDEEILEMIENGDYGDSTTPEEARQFYEKEVDWAFDFQSSEYGLYNVVEELYKNLNEYDEQRRAAKLTPQQKAAAWDKSEHELTPAEKLYVKSDYNPNRWDQPVRRPDSNEISNQINFGPFMNCPDCDVPYELAIDEYYYPEAYPMQWALRCPECEGNAPGYDHGYNSQHGPAYQQAFDLAKSSPANTPALDYSSALDSISRDASVWKDMVYNSDLPNEIFEIARLRNEIPQLIAAFEYFREEQYEDFRDSEERNWEYLIPDPEYNAEYIDENGDPKDEWYESFEYKDRYNELKEDHGGMQAVDDMYSLLKPYMENQVEARVSSLWEEAPKTFEAPEYWSQEDSMMRDLVEEVPLAEIRRYREFDRDLNDGVNGYFEELEKSIGEHGITTPVILDYNPTTGLVHISEGNHRIKIAEKLGLPAVPARVMTSNREPSSEGLGGAPVPKPYPPDRYGYVPSTLKPSDIGIGIDTLS